ncbi:hypothetical protein BJ138DRAFT_1143109 [Hygrophoropsis aurantiaca]|uniref:Uncharacterized protein n=1 Tax=Hygrophoropsis aurantiaca TaxID=72124 RepID=A0ACB8AND6_9AGAM|nr:hypothetical protein BJ138DRAFT_1143109 [Hygrophoropsis aurantiaca]
MSTLDRKALLSLDIIIVGGSNSGLATAFRLCKAGHRVRIFERGSKSDKYPGGIRLPPNLTKILDEWGLGQQLAQQAQSTQGSQCISVETGETIGHMQWGAEVMAELGSQFMLMHYSDFRSILQEAAVSAGVQISYNKAVVRVFPDPSHIQLLDGEEIYADLIIGADGPSSVVREAIVNPKLEDPQMGSDKVLVYSVTIPRERLKEDPELDAFTNPELGGPQYPFFMGHSRLAVGFPMRGGSEYTLQLCFRDDSVDSTDAKDWDMPISGEALKSITGDLRLQKILNLSSSIYRVRYVDREPLSEWMDQSGRLLVIGEAAHPSIPCGNHACSLQIEDAEVLGTLFSRLHSWDQIHHLTEAFQELRQARCDAIRQSDKIALRLALLPPGPDRNARNDMLRSMMPHAGPQGWSDEKIRCQWEEVRMVFGYSAREAAEDWWIMWGLLRERSKTRELYDKMQVPIEVTEVTRQDDTTAN